MASLERRPQGARTVVYLGRPGADPLGHEGVTQRAIARELAELKGCAFGGDYEPQLHDRMAPYFVPCDTLDTATADRLGVRGEHDLFGGVVPETFVATKIITHPLVAPDAQAPAGWSADFAEQVRTVALPGYSAFALADAMAAGRGLLARGAVRLKLATGVGGLGQKVVRDAAELEVALGELDAAGALAHGLVLEPNLSEIATYSIGRARLDDLVVTYYGRQRQTTNNRGAEVYGGSDLVLVRGDFDVLRTRPLPQQMRQVLELAGVYHAAALRSYGGLFASRCNYDVAQGRDEAGAQHSGVLEQSWRIGGASGAELAAIRAFLQDPALRVVRASTTEVYGERQGIPSDATIYFAGVDRRVGHLIKYARIAGYDDDAG